MNYLASPPLVDRLRAGGHDGHRLRGQEPLGRARTATPVFLRKSIWPSAAGGRGDDPSTAVQPDMFRKSYAGRLRRGDERWRTLESRRADSFAWDDESTYVQNPPYFEGMPARAAAGHRHRRRARAGDARRLGHDRPHLARGRDQAGHRRPVSTCSEHGVETQDFSSYGARRGNHEVMMRGTFANIRLQATELGGDLPEGGNTYSRRRRSRADGDLRRPHEVPGEGHPARRDRRRRSTAPAPRATGPRRARTCSACAPSSPRASSASTARTSSA